MLRVEVVKIPLTTAQKHNDESMSSLTTLPYRGKSETKVLQYIDKSLRSLESSSSYSNASFVGSDTAFCTFLFASVTFVFFCILTDRDILSGTLLFIFDQNLT